MGNIARALSAFERTIVTKDSPADRDAAGDAAALDERAARGCALFLGRARCVTCYSGRAAFDRVGEFQMRPSPFSQMRRAFSGRMSSALPSLADRNHRSTIGVRSFQLPFSRFAATRLAFSPPI